MARPKWSGYSGAHERQPGEQPTKGRRKAAARTRVAKKKSQEAAVPSPPQEGSLPPVISEAQRKELRARQMRGEDPLRNRPSTPFIPDPDIDVAPLDLYENQLAGRTVAPEVMGRQPGRKPRTLPHDQDLTKYDPDLDRRASEELPVIAAVSAQDQTILAVDNLITDSFTTVRNLREAIETMQQSVQQADEQRMQPESATDHAARMKEIISTAIEPWLMELEDHFNELLGQTGEAMELTSPADQPQR